MSRHEQVDPETEDGRLLMDEDYANTIIQRLVGDRAGTLSWRTWSEVMGQELAIAGRMNTDDEVFRVYRREQNWYVELMKAKGEEGVKDWAARARWTDKWDKYCENQLKLLEAVIPKVVQLSGPLDLQFVSKCIEGDNIEGAAEINRYAFDSSIGPIRKHGRSIGGLVDGCIELCRLKTCINMLSDANQTRITGQSPTPSF